MGILYWLSFGITCLVGIVLLTLFAIGFLYVCVQVGEVLSLLPDYLKTKIELAKVEKRYYEMMYRKKRFSAR